MATNEETYAAAAFMANLSSTSATNSQVNEVHSNDNPIFDNGDYQVEIRRCTTGRSFSSSCWTEIDDNTIPYHSIFLTPKPKWFQLRSEKERMLGFFAERLTDQPLQVQRQIARVFIHGWRMTTQSFRCKTHAHIHTTVSEVIKKVFIQGFRTISENQCLLQILKVTMIGRRDIIKAFKDSNRYEHVSLKISVWQSQSERRSQSNSKK
ncbi:hypothetical protein Tco_0727991 [Tanacetum coccineum]|uniref:Uncharacterized protein n=1 Tax=Tanacetum coccineum TaxID=301880 RepID=A0ABQ4YKT5_9ASTR